MRTPEHLGQLTQEAELRDLLGHHDVELSVVELPSPSDTPPAGSIGYYSDGAQHVAAVVLSASGRRLFFEADVDDVIRSNVIRYVYGDD